MKPRRWPNASRRRSRATWVLCCAARSRWSCDVGPLLRSSIGIAPNWLLAKVASDMQKPDGLVILDEENLPEKILHLAPGDVAGIGPNIQQRLIERGITTMAQLFAASKEEFHAVWKSVRGEQIWRL